MKYLRATTFLGATLLVAPTVQAQLTLETVETRLAAQTVLLDLSLNASDPDSLIEAALARGDVWLEVKVRLLQEKFWQPQSMGQLVLLRKLSYLPLERKYQLTHVNQDQQQKFDRYLDALPAFLNFHAIPVTRLDWLPADTEDYSGDLTAHLYANSIPLTPALGLGRHRQLNWHSDIRSWPLP